jgi:hypothetical protein
MTEFSNYLTYGIELLLGLMFGLLWVWLLNRKKPNHSLLSVGAIGYILVSAVLAALVLILARNFGLLDVKPANDFVVASSYLIVFLLGSVFGIAELISRYRDEPRRALLTWAALLYILVNALASVFALNAIRVFGWLSDGEPYQVAYRQVLIAGLGAMALFRSSLFILRNGNAEINFGPVFVLQIILGAADRALDRRRGRSRSIEVGEIMKDVSYDKASELLPAYCLALMQNLSEEEQKALGLDIASIDKTEISDETAANRQKSVLLGLKLLKVIGTDLLQQAVKSLGDDIKK